MNKIATLLIAALLMTACNFGASTSPTGTASAPVSQATNVPPTSAPQPTAVPANSPVPTTVSSGPTSAAAAVTGNCVQGTGQVVTLASELKYEDLLICDGVEAKVGMAVTIHFIGSLRDGGTKFDSSYDRGQPYTFTLGSGPIQGWDEGIAGMNVGSKRRLTIPPSLAYGNQSHPGIPPNSTLVYDIELVSAR